MATDPRWSDETERIVDDHLNSTAGDCGCGCGHYAEPILARLADRGLLVEPGGETRTEWGVQRGGLSVEPVHCEADADRLVRYYELNARFGFTAVKVSRRVSRAAEPWRPA